jgi:hypothetical protein
VRSCKALLAFRRRHDPLCGRTGAIPSFLKIDFEGDIFEFARQCAVTFNDVMFGQMNQDATASIGGRIVIPKITARLFEAVDQVRTRSLRALWQIALVPAIGRGTSDADSF